MQVIEEIEEMMQDSPEMEAEHNPSQSDLSMLSLDVQQHNSCPDYEESECPLYVTIGYFSAYFTSDLWECALVIQG